MFRKTQCFTAGWQHLHRRFPGPLNGPVGTRKEPVGWLAPFYIPDDRIRPFPQSSLKLLETHSTGERLYIQFHSSLNRHSGGYLLLSVCVCVCVCVYTCVCVLSSIGWVIFFVSSAVVQEVDQQWRRKSNEKKNRWGRPKTPKTKQNKKKTKNRASKLTQHASSLCSQQLLLDLLIYSGDW